MFYRCMYTHTHTIVATPKLARVGEGSYTRLGDAYEAAEVPESSLTERGS